VWERVAWFGSLPLIVALWELVVRAGVVNPVLFPPPSVVAVSMVDYAKSGLLAADLGWSVSRVAVGYLAGAAAAILLGVITGGNRIAAGCVAPLLQLPRPPPPVGL